MAKPKKKLTAAQRAAKKQRKKDFMTVFMNGKQVRVRRPPTIDGSEVERVGSAEEVGVSCGPEELFKSLLNRDEPSMRCRSRVN